MKVALGFLVVVGLGLGPVQTQGQTPTPTCLPADTAMPFSCAGAGGFINTDCGDWLLCSDGADVLCADVSMCGFEAIGEYGIAAHAFYATGTVRASRVYSVIPGRSYTLTVWVWRIGALTQAAAGVADTSCANQVSCPDVSTSIVPTAETECELQTIVSGHVATQPALMVTLEATLLSYGQAVFFENLTLVQDDIDTCTPTNSPTDTPSGTPTPTNTPTDTPTPSNTPTNTPSCIPVDTGTPFACQGAAGLISNDCATWSLCTDGPYIYCNWTSQCGFLEPGESGIVANSFATPGTVRASKVYSVIPGEAYTVTAWVRRLGAVAGIAGGVQDATCANQGACPAVYTDLAPSQEAVCELQTVVSGHVATAAGLLVALEAVFAATEQAVFFENLTLLQDSVPTCTPTPPALPFGAWTGVRPWRLLE